MAPCSVLSGKNKRCHIQDLFASPWDVSVFRECQNEALGKEADSWEALQLVSAVQCAAALPRHVKLWQLIEEMSHSDAQQIAQLKYRYMNSISVFVLCIFSTQESEVGAEQHRKNLV